MNHLTTFIRSRGGKRRNIMGQNSSGRVFKALFGALTLVGFICLLLVGVLETGGRTNSTTTTASRHLAASRLKDIEVIGREKLQVHPNINFMSKRRVPNGPDPIHNRRAGSSRRPPGQA